MRSWRNQRSLWGQSCTWAAGVPTNSISTETSAKRSHFCWGFERSRLLQMELHHHEVCAPACQEQYEFFLTNQGTLFFFFFCYGLNKMNSEEKNQLRKVMYLSCWGLYWHKLELMVKSLKIWRFLRLNWSCIHYLNVNFPNQPKKQENLCSLVFINEHWIY